MYTIRVSVTDSSKEHHVHRAQSGWISGASKCRYHCGEFLCVCVDIMYMHTSFFQLAINMAREKELA